MVLPHLVLVLLHRHAALGCWCCCIGRQALLACRGGSSGHPLLREGEQKAHGSPVRGRDMRMDSMRPPVFRPKMVPRSYTRLNSV